MPKTVGDGGPIVSRDLECFCSRSSALRGEPAARCTRAEEQRVGCQGRLGGHPLARCGQLETESLSIRTTRSRTLTVTLTVGREEHKRDATSTTSTGHIVQLREREEGERRWRREREEALLLDLSSPCVGVGRDITRVESARLSSRSQRPHRGALTCSYLLRVVILVCASCEPLVAFELELSFSAHF